MDKKAKIKILNFIAYTNWIIVALIFINMITMSRITPYPLGTILGYYLLFSFAPPLITTVLVLIINKNFKGFNLKSNVIFLILYVLIFGLAKYMITRA